MMRSTGALMSGLLAAVVCSIALSAQGGGGLEAVGQSGASPGMDLSTPAVLGGDSVPDFIIGPGTGVAPARAMSGVNGGELASGFIFGGFGGGVRMAAGDINGDGVADIVAGMGPGGSLVQLLSGVDAANLGSGYPFGAGFRGGVYVATGDVNGDGRTDIIVGQGNGGGRVMVFSGIDISLLMNVAPFGSGYTGGATVAAGDVNGDGLADVFVGQASGGAVSLIDGATRSVIASAPVFGPRGVFVALGDVNGDGRADAIMAPGSGNGPVLVYDVLTLTQLAAFVPYPAGFSGGVRVASTDFDGDGRAEIITAPGPGGGSTVRVFSGGTFAAGPSFNAYGPGFNGGVFVAAPARVNTSSEARFTSAAAATFTVGEPGSFTVTTEGSPAVTLITQAGALPAGVTFTNNGDGTATLAGTPAAPGASFPLTFNASNGVGAAAVQAFSLTVNPAPAITSAAAVTFTVGVAGSFTVTTEGNPALTLITQAGPLPADVTFTNNGDGTATLAGTPAAPGGSFPLTFNASNGVGAAAVQEFTLTVNEAPAVNAQNDTFTGAVGNTQFVVGAGALGAPHVFVGGDVLGNDTGEGALSAGPAGIASTNGGLVAMAANGTFVYTPPVGFAGPSDTFTYTLTDANGTDTAVVTIGLGNVVWYVNAGSAGDGRSHSPFGTMTAAAAAAGPGNAIYVHQGSPSGDTVLKAGQTLWGAGATFTFGNLSIPATTSPTLGGTVTLANNVLVTGLIVNAGGGNAIVATGLTGTETLNQVSIISGGVGLNLTNLGGSLNLVGGSIAGVAGTDVLVSGGNGTIAIGAAITNTLGRSIDVQGRNGGAVTFSGAITDSGQGIFLNNNPGSAINFTGGMALVTGAFPAFTATAGGTIVATQDNVAIVNTIATTDGTALQVINTDIGTAGLTFRTISAGLADTFTLGAGIILDNTGTDVQHGGLTVTGTGVPQSGGLIRRKTGADGVLTDGVGIYLSSTKNPSFSWMELNRLDNSGIVGRNVAGFLLADSVITIAGTTAGIAEGPIVFGQANPGGINGLQGLAVLRNTVISDGVEDNVQFYNQSGTMQLLVERTTPIPGDCFIGQDQGIGFGGRGLRIQLEGNAMGSATVSQCRFRHNLTIGLLATAADDSNLTLLVTGLPTATLRSEFTQGGSGQGDEGIVVSNSGNADLTARIENTLFSGLPDGGIRVAQSSTATDDSLLDATIKDNFFESTGAVSGGSIVARLSGVQSQARLLIDNNRGAVQDGIEQYGLAPGIVITTPDPATTPEVDVTITNNHVDMMGPDDGGVFGPLGIHVRAENGAMCADVQNNISHWMPPDTTPQGGGIRLEKVGGGSLSLARGIAGELETDPAVVLGANNPPPFNPPPEDPYLMITEVFGAVLLVPNGTCQVPPTP